MAITAAVLLAGGALAQGRPPEPTIQYLTTYEVANPPAAPIDAYQVVIDFAPGQWIAEHYHVGTGFATVMEGALMRDVVGVPLGPYGPGAGWIEDPILVHSAGNDGGTVARLLATFVVPYAAPLSSSPEGAPTGVAAGPTTVYLTKLERLTPPTSYNVVQFVRDYAPGAWTTEQANPGMTIVTVVAGEVTSRAGKTAQSFGPGQYWVEPAGEPHASGNTGAGTARVVVSMLVPRAAVR